jgi:cyclic pyranopterin monophosphate synthase
MVKMKKKRTETKTLSHISENGTVQMVDVSQKTESLRVAIASSVVLLEPATIQILKMGQLQKGDALACARIAGFLAAKTTPSLIPLCHQIPIDDIALDFKLNTKNIVITARVTSIARTGVEMEALAAVTVAALTIYDMCKAVDRSMRIDHIQLVEKKKRAIS